MNPAHATPPAQAESFSWGLIIVPAMLIMRLVVWCLWPGLGYWPTLGIAVGTVGLLSGIGSLAWWLSRKLGSRTRTSVA